ncbi:hypothetical protein HUJ04_001299 [Dendroctonus ponderosae]|uniref:RRM domain-containing protein n=2 Tax=Dendroctonus ponderosae TaxID=77166 RepID=A0AAR5Q8B2_DENPD|nr:hypothetical protein HUJ04_001290 [Dendroctonus ponderosae]KAH1012057.1 hypothetical protein HUJ04_001299 [Dendroctonus ponderosae]
MGIVVRQLPEPVMSSVGVHAMTQQQQPNAIASNGGPATKKVLSNGSCSGGPTPAGTPVQNGTSLQGSSPPPLANAPKYGTLVPNRIFVGGISSHTTEGELMQLFSNYGTVKATKIIQDRAGVSKGYGFITFETEEDARRPLRDPDNIVLRERRLNIAPAIKKQPFGRPPTASPYDTHGQADGRSPAPAPHPAALQQTIPPFFFSSTPHFYPSGPAYYASAPVPAMTAAQAQVQVSQAGQEQAAAAAQQAAVYQAPQVYQTQAGHPQAGPYASMMYPQAFYMPQQYPILPYDYQLYGAGAGAPSVNGGMPPPFGPPGPPSSGGSSPPRGPCYAPSTIPAETTIVYTTGPPPPPIFHPAMDPNAGVGAPLYAPAEVPFDHMAHAAAMGHFAPMPPPYLINEENSQYIERPPASITPQSFLTVTPPPEQRRTSTPVVSLLCLDHQQEKDPASMQGGRRPLLHSLPPFANNTYTSPPPYTNPPPPPFQRRGCPMAGPRRSFSRTYNNNNLHHMQVHD